MLEPTRTNSKTYEELTNYERAAVILIALGREISAMVMRSLPLLIQGHSIPQHANAGYHILEQLMQ